eukprot:CAMPEP_0177689362 /NCGR_PEP_ID=MMETSP0484_2-20121128/151_1 /TAXON_ID=354590 /ORGANISM="Rhodomonas lens, Strain RHODO" /LENGTH=271 /DNA_ID=CAMNT_0019199751 /DNA_START=492 /DNA_END=1308 /DNA_ORIENTATION=+
MRSTFDGAQMRTRVWSKQQGGAADPQGSFTPNIALNTKEFNSATSLLPELRALAHEGGPRGGGSLLVVALLPLAAACNDAALGAGGDVVEGEEVLEEGWRVPEAHPLGGGVEVVEEEEDVPHDKAHQVEDVEAPAHDAVVRQQEPGEVDGLDVEEAEHAHLHFRVLPRPHPHDGVEEGLGEEGEARDLAAVLLVHADADHAEEGVEHHERAAVEHEVPQVLRSLPVVHHLEGLGVVKHEDSLHEHVVSNRPEVGERREQPPELQLEHSWPV